ASSVSLSPPLLPATPRLSPYPTLFRSRPRGDRAGGRPRDDERWCVRHRAHRSRGYVRRERETGVWRRVDSDYVRSSPRSRWRGRSEEHTSELQSRFELVCRLLLEKKKK